jgi:anti-sigma factor RsiW
MSAPRPPHPEHDDRLEAELVLFVDGELGPERAAAIETSAAADSELRDRIALMRAGRDRLRAAAAATEAPFELRRRIDALIAQPPRGRRRWRPLAVLASVGASLAVVLALVLAGGAPSVGDVLDAAGESPAATVTLAGGPLLKVHVEGTRFPDYEQKFGWRAVGQHEDEVDGRLVRTVDYRKGGDRVSYSIVAGDALDEPDGSDLEAEGTRIRRVGDARAVTWRRGGHTCVMEGSPGVSVSTLAELAGWKAKGEISF